MAAFAKLGVVDELCEAAEAMGWQLPTDVQDEAIPLILGGGDVMIAAETGSGKTGAFALPLLQIVHETLQGKARAGREAGVTADAGPARLLDRAAVNAADRDEFVAVDAEGAVCQSRDQRRWGGARCTWGAVSGRAYFECEVTDEGLCRVGWSTADARREVGTDRRSVGFGGTGKKSLNRAFEDYGEPFGLGDTIGCSLDLDASPPTASFHKNGRDLGVAYELPDEMRGGVPLFPSVALKNAEVRFRFGGPHSAAPRHAPPPGHTAVGDLPAGRRRAFEPAAAERAAASDRSGSSSGADLRRHPLAVVLEPTRELANQVSDELAKFKRFLAEPEVTHELVIGGSASKQLAAALERGVNIVVGTPGRLADLVASGAVSLAECRYFVLDEADSLIKEGGRRGIMDMFRKIPRDIAQVVVSSATLHTDEIRRLSEDICHHPTWVDLKGRDSVPDNVDHAVVEVDPLADRSWSDASVPTDHVHDADADAVAGGVSPEALSEGTKRLKLVYLRRIIDAFGMAERQAVIFARTQVDCDNAAEFLRLADPARYRVSVLHSGLSQKDRSGNLAAFKAGDVALLVCTDVAARGIDVAGLPFVVNLSLPDLSETYVHRIGRTGRADAVGLAVSLVSAVNTKEWFHTCRRRDRGRGCRNTEDVGRGGCCTWINEPELLLGVEVRLGGMDIARLDISNVAGGVDAFQRRAAEVRARGDAASAATASHLRFLSGHVERLAALETQAQDSFHLLKSQGRWAAMLRDGGV